MGGGEEVPGWDSMLYFDLPGSLGKFSSKLALKTQKFSIRGLISEIRGHGQALSVALWTQIHRVTASIFTNLYLKSTKFCMLTKVNHIFLGFCHALHNFHRFFIIFQDGSSVLYVWVIKYKMNPINSKKWSSVLSDYYVFCFFFKVTSCLRVYFVKIISSNFSRNLLSELQSVGVVNLTGLEKFDSTLLHSIPVSFFV